MSLVAKWTTSQTTILIHNTPHPYTSLLIPVRCIGVIEPISSILYFLCSPEVFNHCILNITFIFDRCQRSFSCGVTCQIWVWFEIFTTPCCKLRNDSHWEISGWGMKYFGLYHYRHRVPNHIIRNITYSRITCSRCSKEIWTICNYLLSE